MANKQIYQLDQSPAILDSHQFAIDNASNITKKVLGSQILTYVTNYLGTILVEVGSLLVNDNLRITHNGSEGRIETDIVTPSDLVLDCGTQKTVFFSPVIYDEFIPQLTVLATGAASPDVTNHTIQGVIGSYYSFDGAATEERLTVKLEMYHAYAEGEEIEIHVHAMPSTNQAGDVIWYFDYFYSPLNAAPIAGSTLTATETIGLNTQYYDYTTSLGTIDMTGMTVGDFIIGALKRTPTGSDTYPADMLLKQAAAHAPLNTQGSRQRYIKKGVK